MEIALILAGIVVAAVLITVLYYAGYRLGWDDGYDAAYRAMVGDLTQGQKLFGDTGLDNWRIPEHWKRIAPGKYHHSIIPEVEDPDLLGKW